jgi:hypothetical protein
LGFDPINAEFQEELSAAEDGLEKLAGLGPVTTATIWADPIRPIPIASNTVD